MNVIEINHLTRDYGNNRGIFDVSFSVEKGEVIGFLGPNGAGKTTTIRHLMGFIKPQQGTVTINGLDCWTSHSEIQQNLGYIPGEMAFFDDMTGAEFLKFMEKYRNTHCRDRKKEMLDLFQLDPNVKIKKMSKGTKQKLGIVVAFMHDPEVLILDEPTSGLDPLMQSRFIDLILKEKARGKTILMSSHMFEEVERTCHRVCIIKEGRLVTVGFVDELKEQQVKKYVVTLDTQKQAQAFSDKYPNVLSVVENHVTVIVQNNLDEFIRLMNEFTVTNLSAPAQSLEEIFLQYYGGQDNVQ